MCIFRATSGSCISLSIVLFSLSMHRRVSSPLAVQRYILSCINLHSTLHSHVHFSWILFYWCSFLIQPHFSLLTLILVAFFEFLLRFGQISSSANLKSVCLSLYYSTTSFLVKMLRYICSRTRVNSVGVVELTKRNKVATGKHCFITELNWYWNGCNGYALLTLICQQHPFQRININIVFKWPRFTQYYNIIL